MFNSGYMFELFIVGVIILGVGVAGIICCFGTYTATIAELNGVVYANQTLSEYQSEALENKYVGALNAAPYFAVISLIGFILTLIGWFIWIK